MCYRYVQQSSINSVVRLRMAVEVQTKNSKSTRNGKIHHYNIVRGGALVLMQCLCMAMFFIYI